MSINRVIVRRRLLKPKEAKAQVLVSFRRDPTTPSNTHVQMYTRIAIDLLAYDFQARFQVYNDGDEKTIERS